MTLSDVRREFGLTLDQLAEKVGSNKGTLSKIERRIASPSAELMLRIDQWVEECRRQRQLPASFAVDWSYLIEEGWQRTTPARAEAAS